MKFPYEAPKPPDLLAAEARATELISRAQLNEAVRIIEGLELEVAQMPIAARFSRTRKMGEDGQGVVAMQNINPNLAHLTEAEFKREDLARQLRELKNRVQAAVADFKGAVLDIEATKRD